MSEENEGDVYHGFYVLRFPAQLVVAYQGQHIAPITPAYARAFAAALLASADAADQEEVKWQETV